MKKTKAGWVSYTPANVVLPEGTEPSNEAEQMLAAFGRFRTRSEREEQLRSAVAYWRQRATAIAGETSAPNVLLPAEIAVSVLGLLPLVERHLFNSDGDPLSQTLEIGAILDAWALRDAIDALQLAAIEHPADIGFRLLRSKGAILTDGDRERWKSRAAELWGVNPRQGLVRVSKRIAGEFDVEAWTAVRDEIADLNPKKRT